MEVKGGGKGREVRGERGDGGVRANLPSVATEESGLANHFPNGRKFSFNNDLSTAKQRTVQTVQSVCVHVPHTYRPLNEVVQGTVEHGGRFICHLLLPVTSLLLCDMCVCVCVQVVMLQQARNEFERGQLETVKFKRGCGKIP